MIQSLNIGQSFGARPPLPNEPPIELRVVVLEVIGELAQPLRFWAGRSFSRSLIRLPVAGCEAAQYAYIDLRRKSRYTPDKHGK